MAAVCLRSNVDKIPSTRVVHASCKGHKDYKDEDGHLVNDHAS